MSGDVKIGLAVVAVAAVFFYMKSSNKADKDAALKARVNNQPNKDGGMAEQVTKGLVEGLGNLFSHGSAGNDA